MSGTKWGTVSTRVRADIGRLGIIKVASYARETGLASRPVSAALRAGAERGEYVHALGAYWHPGAWQAAQDAIEAWRKDRARAELAAAQATVAAITNGGAS